MSSILEALAASVYDEARVGIITWRLKRASPRVMMDQGLPGIMLLREIVDPAAVAASRKADAVAAKAPPSQGRPDDPKEDTATKLHRQLMRTTEAQKDKAERATRHFEALVCASVTHMRVDGESEEGSGNEASDLGEWVPVRVVPNEQQQDTKQGRLWVGSMPPGTVDRLHPAIMRLCAPKEVEDALRRFRAESEPAADAPADVQDVQQVASRVPGA